MGLRLGNSITKGSNGKYEKIECKITSQPG